VAREATARLYDVDQDSVVLKNLTQSGKYDRGTITFRAKKGKLVDLDKLHESVWATRLSGGTRSGLVSLEVTATGEVVLRGAETVMNVSGFEPQAPFVLAKNPEAEYAKVYNDLRRAVERGERVVSVTGRLDGWTGGWPQVLRQLPPKPRRILVTEFETATTSPTD
jgi:hypothetical protein